MAKSQKFMLAQPEEIILSSSIENPDKHLDALIRGAKGNENLKSRLSAIKLLDNKTKAKWLLDLSDTPGATDRVPSAAALPAVPPVVVCTLVTVTVVVMVIVGYTIVNGVKKAIKERQEREKQVRKCIKQER